MKSSEPYEKEICQFVSAVNREQVKKDVISRAQWSVHERTLYLWVRGLVKRTPLSPSPSQVKPVQAGSTPKGKGSNGSEALVFAHCVHREKQICIYFPDSFDEQPFCYCADDDLVNVVEDINAALCPLARSSVFQAGVVISKAVRAHATTIWGEVSDRHLHRSSFEQDILEELQRNAVGIDLALTIFSMAALSLQRTFATQPNPFAGVLGEDWLTKSGVDFGCIAPLADYLNDTNLLKDLSAENVALLHFICFGQPAKLQLESEDVIQGCIRIKVRLPEDPLFDHNASKHGLTQGYHGSSAENFHSILNCGLRNMTDTSKMKNGAAFGDGVYLAADQAVSLTFAGGEAKAWTGSKFSSQNVNSTPVLLNHKKASAGTSVGKFRYRMIVGCDIIRRPENLVVSYWNKNQVNHHGSQNEELGQYFTVKEESDIRVKELFLYSLDSNFESSNLPRSQAHPASPLHRDYKDRKASSAPEPDSNEIDQRRKWYSISHNFMILVLSIISVFMMFVSIKMMISWTN